MGGQLSDQNASISGQIGGEAEKRPAIRPDVVQRPPEISPIPVNSISTRYDEHYIRHEVANPLYSAFNLPTLCRDIFIRVKENDKLTRTCLRYVPSEK